MKKFCKYLVLAFICLLGTTACNNADRQVKLLEDIYTHSGRLRGYAAVYEIAFDGDIVRSDESFPVYENEDGTYTIICHFRFVASHKLQWAEERSWTKG